jgi:hypothetical protein
VLMNQFCVRSSADVYQASRSGSLIVMHRGQTSMYLACRAKQSCIESVKERRTYTDGIRHSSRRHGDASESVLTRKLSSEQGMLQRFPVSQDGKRPCRVTNRYKGSGEFARSVVQMIPDNDPVYFKRKRTYVDFQGRCRDRPNNDDRQGKST